MAHKTQVLSPSCDSFIACVYSLAGRQPHVIDNGAHPGSAKRRRRHSIPAIPNPGGGYGSAGALSPGAPQFLTRLVAEFGDAIDTSTHLAIEASSESQYEVGMGHFNAFAAHYAIPRDW